eukprot:768288-Hanusia_phi.AAC.5
MRQMDAELSNDEFQDRNNRSPSWASQYLKQSQPPPKEVGDLLPGVSQESEVPDAGCLVTELTGAQAPRRRDQQRRGQRVEAL